jgi:CubicO group peptidase (beta-lactamase class C family)
MSSCVFETFVFFVITMRAVRANVAVALLLIVFSGASIVQAQDRLAVEAELDRLRRDARISALSAAVVEGNTTVWVRHLGFNATRGEAVMYPIASLTKPMAAVLTMQFVGSGAIKLDTVRPLLTHTSTGTPGQRFIYSSELFQGLQPTIEKAAGQSFAAALAARVFKPAGLRNTRAAANISPSTGVESTVEDLARFATALDRNALLPVNTRLEMFRPMRGPTGQPMPYALGWFVQYIGGEEVRWHFGQQADASSLLMMLPRRRLTFIVLARTDRLSSPFWLQMGDLRWSPFAAAFLTGWARVRIDLGQARRAMMQALIALDARRPADAAKHVSQAVGLAPALGDSADGALLAAFARSGEPGLRATGRRIAKRLLAVDADHPRTLVDLAVLNIQDGQPAEATPLLQRAIAGNRATPEIARLVKELLAEAGKLPGAPH